MVVQVQSLKTTTESHSFISPILSPSQPPLPTLLESIPPSLAKPQIAVAPGVQ